MMISRNTAPNGSERRYFFHIDLDAFFASCHIARDPSLRGLPVIVGGDPVTGRGVVSTCSYEARKYGIHSAMPVITAKRLCPEAIFIKPDFTLYSDTSDTVMTFLKRYTKESFDIPGKFRQAGIDEAYIDFSDRIIHNRLDPVELAKDIQKQVEIYGSGVTCSIGIAPTKTCAKIASDENKPNGITYVPQGKVKEFLAPLPVRRMPGIGKKTSLRLQRWGIATIGQLSRYSVDMLPDYLKYFWEIANGLHTGEVSEEFNARKSISHERTFFDCIKAGEEAYRHIERLVSKLHAQMLEEGFACRTISLKIRRKDFKTFNRSLSLPEAITDFDTIAALAREILYRWIDIEEYETGKTPEFRLLGVRLSNFDKQGVVVKPLTAWFRNGCP